MNQHPMHEQHEAVLLSLSAIAFMADHPYQYWREKHVIASHPSATPEMKANAERSIERCEKVMRELCEKIDAAMQYIGDCNNAVDAVDDHGHTNAAFAQMDRALGRADGKNARDTN